jgi:antitoxin YefM
MGKDLADHILLGSLIIYSLEYSWPRIMIPAEITTPAKARAEFFQLLDRVAASHQVCIIKRREGENVALIAESDLNSLLEIVYLLRSPANAQRLLDGMAEVKSGKILPQSVLELEQEISFDQT